MRRLQRHTRRLVFSLPIGIVCLLMTFVAVPSVPEDVAKWGPVFAWIDGTTARWIVPTLGLLGFICLIGVLATGRSTANAGPVSVAVAEPSAPTPFKAQNPALSSALHDLLDELALGRLRLERAQQVGQFGYDFFLPLAAYEQHKRVLDSGLRQIVADAYVRFDHLNTELGQYTDGVSVLGFHDLPGIIKAVERAERALRRRWQ